MKWKQELKAMAREKGYLLALTVCLAAVAVSGWLFVRSLRTDDEAANTPDAVQAAVLPTLPQSSDAARPSTGTGKKPGKSTAPQDDAQTDLLTPTEQPVSAQDTPARPGEVLYRPVDGTVVTGYSMDKLAYNATTKDWRTHAGMDLAAPEGSEVRAVAEGTVLSVFMDDLLGQTVTVEHAAGFVTHYANLAEEVSVAAGDHVAAGQTIGTVGKTALGEVGSAPHLHFAVYKNNVPQDPSAYLPN